MQEFMKNGIVQSVLGALIVVFILWLISVFRSRSDENKILEFLRKSLKETPHKFRTTHAISSDTNLSEERIRKICSKSKTIKRNTNEKESWKLLE